MLIPILVLALWTLVIQLAMFATRIPAMAKAGVKPDAGAHVETLRVLPSSVRRIGDNYNHLHEQPTTFYAVALVAHLAAAADPIAIAGAWAYVGLRILHSLVQTTFNAVLLRFVLFNLSSAAIAVIAARALWALLDGA